MQTVRALLCLTFTLSRCSNLANKVFAYVSSYTYVTTALTSKPI